MYSRGIAKQGCRDPLFSTPFSYRDPLRGHPGCSPRRVRWFLGTGCPLLLVGLRGGDQPRSGCGLPRLDAAHATVTPTRVNNQAGGPATADRPRPVRLCRYGGTRSRRRPLEHDRAPTRGARPSKSKTKGREHALRLRHATQGRATTRRSTGTTEGGGEGPGEKRDQSDQREDRGEPGTLDNK